MTLTKAELADLLFEKVGLNKREAKDMVEAFSKKFGRWKPVMASSFLVSAIFSCATSRSVLDAIPRRAGNSHYGASCRNFPCQPKTQVGC
jgi:hypothetical protein